MAVSQVGCSACKEESADLPLFKMAFQPIVDVSRSRIYGYEALVRGVEDQSAFSVLSQVTEANRYAFDQACRVMAIEQAAKLGLDRRLSINFMPNAVYNPAACIRQTLDAATRVGFPLDRINFEITEDERIVDVDHLQNIITEYRKHGFRVALDDFGSEFAGLASLASLDVNIVKLDRGLVTDINRRDRQRVITSGIIQTCQKLGIDVVAEGVETREELSVLIEEGVRYIQGFLFARPKLDALLTEADLDFSLTA